MEYSYEEYKEMIKYYDGILNYDLSKKPTYTYPENIEKYTFISEIVSRCVWLEIDALKVDLMLIAPSTHNQQLSDYISILYDLFKMIQSQYREDLDNEVLRGFYKYNYIEFHELIGELLYHASAFDTFICIDNEKLLYLLKYKFEFSEDSEEKK